MNKQLQDFARTEIKKGLANCSKKQRVVFRRLYSHENLGLPINKIVDKLDADELDWTMEQVKNTLKSNTKKRVETI